MSVKSKNYLSKSAKLRDAQSGHTDEGPMSIAVLRVRSFAYHVFRAFVRTLGTIQEVL